MNIWEAYECAKFGKVIKIEDDKEEDTVFVFRTVEEPIGVIRFKRVELSRAGDGNRPKSVRDLDYEDLDDVCIKTFERQDFVSIEFDEMIKA